MHRFQHLLVDLALDDRDGDLLRWAQHVATLSGSDKLTVVHSWENEDIPGSLREKYPWLVAPGAELLEGRARKVIDETLSPEWAAHTELRLEQGDRLKNVLRLARDESVDLILSVRCPLGLGADNYSTRLARKAPCAVFFIQPEQSPKYEKVLVPVDFSEHSERALDFGCALARAAELKSVSVLRCFQIPYGQHRATISREEFTAEFERYESERMDKYLAAREPEDLSLSGEVVECTVAAYGISAYAKEIRADVMVLGSRGRHAASAILLGSTAETVLRQVESSVLIIKPKGTGLSLLASLLGD